ncbi:hypothetical protein AgCh_007435 [Apium graveolens]
MGDTSQKEFMESVLSHCDSSDVAMHRLLEDYRNLCEKLNMEPIDFNFQSPLLPPPPAPSPDYRAVPPPFYLPHQVEIPFGDVKASELPLVGNVAPDFEAEAVFDQEFMNVEIPFGEETNALEIYGNGYGLGFYNVTVQDNTKGGGHDDVWWDQFKLEKGLDDEANEDEESSLWSKEGPVKFVKSQYGFASDVTQVSKTEQKNVPSREMSKETLDSNVDKLNDDIQDTSLVYPDAKIEDPPGIHFTFSFHVIYYQISRLDQILFFSIKSSLILTSYWDSDWGSW